MRTTGRLAIIASILVAGSAGAAYAQALPAPPYQTADQGQNPAYGAFQSMDRYGGGRGYIAPVAPTSTLASTSTSTSTQADQGPALYRPASQIQTQPAGPRLTWSGKTEPQTQQAQPAQSGDWSSMAQRWGAPVAAPQARPATQVQVQEQAQQGWRPYRPQAWSQPQAQPAAPAQAQPAPAPTSIYSPPSQAIPTLPPPPPAQYRQAQNGESGPRFYSVHREYGIEPDAIPLPPQFFGATADLSTPNTDPLVKRTTTVNGQTHVVAVTDDQSSQ